MQILWYKRDLRLQDHEPLQSALERAPQLGPVLAVYLHEPSIIAQPDTAAQHSAFLRETLDDLRMEFQSYGHDFLEEVGEAIEVFSSLYKQTPFSHLWAYQESGTQATYARDKAVAAWCRAHDVTFTELPQNGVRRGSEFRERGFQFREHLNDACGATFFAPSPGMGFAPLPRPSCTPSAPPAGLGNDKPNRLRGGRTEALRHLNAFTQLDKLMAYPNVISSPNTAPAGCSRLSPYLALGILSDREVFQLLNNTVRETSPQMHPARARALQNSVQFFADRLNWRCAYLQSFERQVETETQDDLSAFNGVRESELNREWLSAWEQGRTGYPMIDAAMAMLADTGWINMRMRGMLVSFAVNELWLPWRDVGLHLAREFLDYEPGIHWNQLQIHAGSSRLSGPLTYNAVKQAQDHDAEGIFVRSRLPALRNVPPAYIFEPWRMPRAVQEAAQCVIGVDYPAPIVPLLAANDAAKKRVSALREGKPQPNLAYVKKRDAELAAKSQDSLF